MIKITLRVHKYTIPKLIQFTITICDVKLQSWAKERIKIKWKLLVYTSHSEN